MQKYKSLGPNGWTVEFFQHLFDLMGDSITIVVEESRKKGIIYDALKSSFLSLTPKMDSPSSFDDFRPISLCNCIYKVIAKTIANKLKPMLSCNISKEKFGCLDGRQIHEAIGVAHETLHNINLTRKKCMIVNIDLLKAYDRITWLYLRLLLTHLGFRI